MARADIRPGSVENPRETRRDGLVLPLRALGRGDLATAGGKGANLGELLRCGFAVPDGYVVSTSAYDTVVERAGLTATISECLAAGDDGATIRSAFAAAPVPEEVRAAIAGAYADLGGGPVAVRSSATAEDLPGAAFAGQQDTFLNVIGEEEVIDAVRRCWGSLWTGRAIAYRERRGISSGEVRIAVVVQRMVTAESAGVMFTANPVTGNRDEITVDASPGLGEAVVSGRVTPDHYVLDRRGRVRESAPGKREVVVRAVPGGGVTEETREGDGERELPRQVLGELARTGASVADRFGRPQDIEWAYADGRVWLVQARPMTAVPPPPIRLNRIQRFTGPQLVEMFPVRPYPLDMSAWILPGPGRMVARMLAELPGLRVRLAEMLPETDGVVDRYIPPVPRPTLRLLTAPARLLPRIRRFDPAGWTDDPRFVEFDRGVRELAARDLEALEWPELLGVPRQALDLLDSVTDLRVDYLPRAGAALLRLRLFLKALGLTDLFPALILGAPTRTGDANSALAALAERVREDPRLHAAFTEDDAGTLAERVRDTPAFAGFRAELEGFLDEYGHRETASPLLVSAPTWKDSPAVVLGAIRVMLEDRPGPAQVDHAGAALERLLEHRAARRPRGRRWILRTVAAARAGIACREDTHFHFTRTLPLVRHALLEMGRRLAAAGVLGDREEVLHLRLAELAELPDPNALSEPMAGRLRRIVLARSARRAELEGVPLIAPAVLFPHAANDPDALVTGTPGGGGRATGPVRVIRDPSEFGRLRGGDVLVCPYTNPSWTPLFQRAVAVVVDTGGVGSHAAIVAREYGIPAVMGSATGTTTLTDGRLVTVDGATGQVTASARGEREDS